MSRFIVDAHLDLAMNAIEWNRDLKNTVETIRQREVGMDDKLDRSKGTVALPELRAGNIGLVVATQIARYVEEGSLLPGWNSPEIAWSITQAQLAWYRSMEVQGEMIQVIDLEGLNRHLEAWSLEGITNGKKPIGYILSLEGADSFIDISYLEKSYSDGLRACGLAHYGSGRYAPGTGMSGGLTRLGKELMQEMEQLNIIMDVTHLTDEGFQEVTEQYKGPVWASHHNCRTIIDHQRQLTDEQIKVLIDRGAVIGGVLDTWMLDNGWQRGVHDSQQRNVKLERLLDHYDHICQIAGNSQHIAIGSDLDGGYGREQSPCDLDTIADLQNLEGLLVNKGYSDTDIDNIFHDNWLRFLRRAWS